MNISNISSIFSYFIQVFLGTNIYIPFINSLPVLIIRIPTSSIRINMLKRIICTVRIWTPLIILFCHWIHHMPSPQCRIHHPRPIIIPIQPMHPVQLFPVILIGLFPRSFSIHFKYSSERIVMIHLFCVPRRSVQTYHHPIISLMIFQVIVKCWSCPAQSDISFFCEHLAQTSVFIDHISAIIHRMGL